MSREIEFRCWDGEFMNTVSGLYFCQGGIKWDGPGVGSGWCHLNPDFNWDSDRAGNKPEYIDILMQYTGLKDKKGKKKAYESDIVQTYYDDGRKGDIGYLECTNLGSLCVVVKGRPTPIPLYFYPSWEIIGNVHENPNLLEGK
jgi:hypothetical protein